MTTQEQIAELVRKHEFQEGKYSAFTTRWRHFIDDLCALFPPVSQLSREELGKILYRSRVTQETSIPFEDLLDQIMDWTTPHPLRREDLDALWKQHMPTAIGIPTSASALKEAIWRWVCGDRAESKVWCVHVRWYLRNSHGINILVDDDWKKCPVCSAPRPATPRAA